MAITDVRLAYGTGVVVGFRAAANYVQGGFYVLLNINGSVTFGPGEANETTIVTGLNQSHVAYYDDDLNFQWVKSVRSGGGTSGNQDLVVDAVNGNVYVGGQAGAGEFIAPGQPGTFLIPVQSGFVGAWNSAGLFQGAIRVTGAADFRGLAAIPAGGFIGVGSFSGTATFNPTGVPFPMTSAGNDDAFISRYNSTLVFQWARRVITGGARNRCRKAVISPITGHVIVAGMTRNSPIGASDDAGAVAVTLGPNDTGIVASFDANTGSIYWAKSASSNGDTEFERIRLSPDGSRVVVVPGASWGSTGLAVTVGHGQINQTTVNGMVPSIIDYFAGNGNLFNAVQQGPTAFDANNSALTSEYMLDGRLMFGGIGKGAFIAGGLAGNFGAVRVPWIVILDPNDPNNNNNANAVVVRAVVMDTEVTSAASEVIRLKDGTMVWVAPAAGTATFADGEAGELTHFNATQFLAVQKVTDLELEFAKTRLGTHYYGAGLDAGLAVIGNRKPAYGSP